MRNLKILSTACGAMFMHGFFKCLKENGERDIQIVGVDMENDSVVDPIIDKFYSVPPISSPHYIEKLLEICDKESIDIFFPQISMELELIRTHIEDFQKLGVKVAITDNEALKAANNKLKVYELMNTSGILTPQFYKIKSIEDLHDAAEMLGYPNCPVCVKVAESSGSRGVRIVMPNLSKGELFLNAKPSSMYVTMEEMDSILKSIKSWPDMIVMEYLPGCEYTVDLLANHGHVIYMAGRRNTISQTSIAMESIVEKNDSAYNMASSLVKLFQLDGNIGFDFMMDKNDNPIITDINPRITATIVLYKEAGINFPYLRVKQLLGEELPEVKIRYGVKMKRRYEEIYKCVNI